MKKKKRVLKIATDVSIVIYKGTNTIGQPRTFNRTVVVWFGFFDTYHKTNKTLFIENEDSWNILSGTLLKQFVKLTKNPNFL